MAKKMLLTATLMLGFMGLFVSARDDGLRTPPMGKKDKCLRPAIE